MIRLSAAEGSGVAVVLKYRGQESQAMLVLDDALRSYSAEVLEFLHWSIKLVDENEDEEEEDGDDEDGYEDR
jgi:hypothetical protein